jgi:hypothetical protein
MQLYDLIAKLKTIEDHPSRGQVNEGLEIMPMMPGHAESQPDNVSMSINVNGQGEGGIRSIMNILRGIEGNDSHGAPSHEHDPKEPLIGDMVKDMNDDIENDTGEESPLSDAPEEEVEEGNANDDGETWANSAHGDAGQHTHGVDAVTFSGDDMNSKGKISPVSRAPGTNALREPSQFDEALVNRLSAMYQEIKEGDKKPMSRAAKGNEKYGKDGMKALAKAGREGKDLDKVRNKYDKYDESAKWRDPKHKDKLYTQEPRSDEDDYYGDLDYYNPKPDDYPGAKNLKGGGEFDHNDPLKKGYGRYGAGSPVEKGPRKGLPSRNHITSLKGSIKTAHGKHHAPNLPEQMNESVELNDMLALNKRLNG